MMRAKDTWRVQELCVLIANRNNVVFQEAVSVADVVLWAALYPILSDPSLALGKY